MGPEKWRQPGNWAGIKAGVSLEQVQELLGEAHKVLGDVVDGHKMLTWFYGPFPAGGQVEFSDGRVWNWVVPDWRSLLDNVHELHGYSGLGN